MSKKEQDTILKSIQGILKGKEHIAFCYLFGSFAYGNTTKESDVDIAVYISADPNEFFNIRLELMEKLTRNLHCQADVVTLNTASPFLKYTILREGILAFERDRKKRVEFELRALNDYFDYKPILQLYRDRLTAAA